MISHNRIRRFCRIRLFFAINLGKTPNYLQKLEMNCCIMEEERQGRWNTVKIYLDSYIVTAFWLHLLCLYLVGTIGKKRYEKRNKRRMAIAALVCAVADAASVVLLYGGESKVRGILFFLIAIAEFFIGSRIAFGKQGLWFNGVLLFVITAFLAGFFQVMPVRNAGLFCLLGTILLPIGNAVITELFRSKQIQNELYEVKLYLNHSSQSLAAFMDTGNRLRLYGSRVPVVLVDETYLTDWIKAAEVAFPQKQVFLPYKGVGGKGILHGIRLQCELLLENGRCIRGEVAAVAAEHRLFAGCRYQMILQPEVLSMVCVNDAQEGEKNVI